MSSIQDIHALEERIYDYVEDYLGGNYAPDDVLAISARCGKVSLKADAKGNIKIGKTTEVYPFSTLVRLGDNNAQEPDNDKISDIANSWVFLN